MRFRILVAACGLVISAAVLQAGGWGVISVDRLPSHVTAGEPVELTYAFRQHGVHLRSGLPARVEATSGTERIVGTVRAEKRAGYYTASFTLPRPGEWVVVLHSGHAINPGNATWLPMVALAPGQAPPTFTAAEWGARLFVAKGCMTCHKHMLVDTPSLQVSLGPSFSTKARQPDRVKERLRNPTSRERDEFGQMPNLELSEKEIDALTAFLTEAPRSTRR